MKNALLAADAKDPDKVANGVDVTYFIGEKSYRCRIKQGGQFNGELSKASEKLMRPYSKAGMSIEQLPIEKQKDLLAKLYAEHVLIGWNEEDFQQAFSVENAYETLKQADGFRIWLISQSTDQDLFRSRAVEEISGN